MATGAGWRKRGRGARFLVLACLLSLGLAACGGGGGGGGPADAGDTPPPSPPPVSGVRPNADYLPLTVAARWESRSNVGVASILEVVGTIGEEGRTYHRLQQTEYAGNGDVDRSERRLLRQSDGIYEYPTAADDDFGRALGAIKLLTLPLASDSRWVVVDRRSTGEVDLDNDGRADTLQVGGDGAVVGVAPLVVGGLTVPDVVQVRITYRITFTLSSDGSTGAIDIVFDNWRIGNTRALGKDEDGPSTA